MDNARAKGWFTEAAGIVPHLAREEAERRHQYSLGPSTCSSACSSRTTTWLPGCCARTVWTWNRPGRDDRLFAEGVLPGPQPSDTELLA